MLCVFQVLENFRTSGFDFLLKAFNSPNYLEDLTGLSELYAQTADDQVCNDTYTTICDCCFVVCVCVCVVCVLLFCCCSVYLCIHAGVGTKR